ncbi:MAG: YlqD family protein [Armatimonadota bacterium]
MASVTIRCPVVLKAIVTDKLKQEMTEELQQRLDQSDQEIAQIEEYRSQAYTELAKTDIQRAMAVRRQLEAHKRQKEQEKEQLAELVEQVQGLEVGVEVVRDVLESSAEVNEGDNLREIRSMEIVVRDDIVEAIRVAEEPPEPGLIEAASEPSTAPRIERPPISLVD